MKTVIKTALIAAAVAGVASSASANEALTFFEMLNHSPR